MKDKEKDKQRKATEAESKPEQNATTATVVEEPVVAEPVSEPAPPPGMKERRFRQTDLPAHFIERRKHPRISTQQPPPPAPPRFDDYASIIGKPELD